MPIIIQWESLITFIVVVILILVFWSRVMQQSMTDTLNEIKEFIKGLKQDGI